MKKTEYLQKLSQTKVTLKNTIAEGRQAEKVAATLGRYLEREAIKYVKKNQEIDLKKETTRWTYLKFHYDLKPTGNIIIEQYPTLEMGYAYYNNGKPLSTYTVPKKELFQ